jgi:hypothetical protein
MQAIQCADIPTENYSNFILDLCLTELHLQRFTPSTLALASLLVTWKKFGSTDPYSKFGFGP